jgi:23S rRNA pseudouridine1911/1915/1917 synthase
MNEGASSVSATIAAEMDGWRLDRALATLIPTMSRERLKALISTGQVTNGTALTRDPSAKVKSESIYDVIIPAPRAAENEAQDIDLVIVYEDDHLLVVDKQAGLVVHPAAGNFDGTLVNALLHHCAGRLSGIGGVARPGIVHRIDKDTSGLMVVAKTDRAHEGLAKQFMDHSITRRYHAIISGRLMRDEGTVNAPLARSTANRKKMAIVEEGRGKHAITHYKLITPLKSAALIECRLETGRTHQIRVHMSSIGHPLLGDPVYGRISQAHRETLGSLDFARQALHATVIGFVHPIDRKNLSFESKMPLDMQRLFTKLSA